MKTILAVRTNAAGPMSKLELPEAVKTRVENRYNTAGSAGYNDNYHNNPAYYGAAGACGYSSPAYFADAGGCGGGGDTGGGGAGKYIIFSLFLV